MMTSSDHLSDPFTLRYSFPDYFYPTPNDTISLSNDDFNLLHSNHQSQNQSLSPISSSDFGQQFQHKPTTTTPTTPTLSASDPETSTTPKRRTTTTLNSKPRINKRKSRATKKNQTTFITTDPANFRQMVQQVTGIRFDNNSSSSSPFPSSRPETRRPIGSLYNATLDTPSIDQNQSLISDRGVYGGLGSVRVGAQSVNGDQSGYGGGASYGVVSFPTLESWKVM